jgi:site-specific DNA-methyltransferase (adenine-specific)
MMNEHPDNKVIPLPQLKESNYLTHLEKARSELELATQVDEVKKIRDKMAAIQMYLKQSGQGLEIQNLACEIKIRSERKLGTILTEIILHEGGRPKNSDTMSQFSSKLSDIGISRKQSSRWQQISSIPKILFEERLEVIKKRGDELTSVEFLSLSAYLQRQRDRETRRESAANDAKEILPDKRMQILHGDFREVLDDIPDNSVDLIVTDPIYLKENLDDWSNLSLFASQKLKIGKLLVCYSSANILDESIKRLSEHLKYVWTMAIFYPSAKKPHHVYRIDGRWKPILLFSNGTYQPDLQWICDVITGDGVTKDHHEWEQGIQESEYIIKNLSVEHDLVVDPFLGSGTTALASKRLNRRFMGSDVDINAVNISLSRLVQMDS